VPPEAGHTARNHSPAFRWRRRRNQGYLVPVRHPHLIRLADLRNSDHQISEIEPRHLADLPDVVELVRDRPERFNLFSNDLAFSADDPSYKALKAAFDGCLPALRTTC
jgi:hypothetical protein